MWWSVSNWWLQRGYERLSVWNIPLSLSLVGIMPMEHFHVKVLILGLPLVDQICMKYLFLGISTWIFLQISRYCNLTVNFPFWYPPYRRWRGGWNITSHVKGIYAKWDLNLNLYRTEWTWNLMSELVKSMHTHTLEITHAYGHDDFLYYLDYITT